MLLHLAIRDFAIVPELELDFESGFTAITGETGAGKSILVGALGLLLGARADSSWVRAGADRAELSAEFSLSANAAARAWLSSAELGDGDNCLLRRSLQDGGRSRAWINGTPVTLQQLNELGALLVELHGQNEHVQLGSRRRQLELLDTAAGCEKLLATVAGHHTEWQAASEALAAALAASALPPGELELARHQLRELEQQELEPEKIRKLEQEFALLSRSGDLLQALDYGMEVLGGDEQALLARLSALSRRLADYRGLDPRVNESAEMLEVAAINCQEARAALQAAADHIDLSPERLGEMETRLATLNQLARKHRVPMEELGRVAADLSERIAGAEHFDERRAALEAEVETALLAYRKAALALSKARVRKAGTLASAVTDLMAELGMAGGVFQISLEHQPDARPSPLGTDLIQMLVSANPGMPPAPLGKVASGGELSRISLAIKVATVGKGEGAAQVFDEIDAGIGGDTANTVGRLLRQAAAGGQALCVTHLAQVAVRADQQLCIRKSATADSTSVAATALGRTERVDEIARMLGGKITGESRAHAAAMLEAAGKSG